MRKLAVALWFVSLAGAACAAPSQYDPATYGAVTLALGPPVDGVAGDWRDDQRAALGPLPGELSALGPAFAWTTEGAADYVIRPAALGGACGRYVAGNRFVEADPACTAGYLALRRAAAHEVMHAVLFARWHFLGHLCSWPINQPAPPGCHPTIVCADCLLSPGLVPPDDGPTWTEVYTGAIADPTPAFGDLELVRQCHARGRCE